MPATAWDSFCSAWFSVFSHWVTTNSFFSPRSCSLLDWQCLVVLLCSARFIFSVCLSQASAFLWPAMSPALLCRGSDHCAAVVNMRCRSLRIAGTLLWLLCENTRSLLLKFRATLMLERKESSAMTPRIVAVAPVHFRHGKLDCRFRRSLLPRQE